MILGVTGGIGMGKSITADILLKNSIPVIDSDDLAREAVEPGTRAYEKIVQRYGKTSVLEDQTLNRSFIAQKVFSSTEEKEWLETTIHPEIHSLRDQKMAQIQKTKEIKAKSNVQSFLVAWIVPLLFEKGMQNEVDFTVCIASTKSTQFVRLKKRNWTDDEISRRLQNQWPVERKASIADFVIWNEFNLDILEKQINLILDEI